MNELISHEGIAKDLEASLGGDFSPDEMLVMRSILSVKAMHGMASRLNVPIRAFLAEDNIPMWEHMLEYRRALDKLASETRKLSEEYAAKLGIDACRYHVIEKYVYDNERKL